MTDHKEVDVEITPSASGKQRLNELFNLWTTDKARAAQSAEDVAQKILKERNLIDFPAGDIPLAEWSEFWNNLSYEESSVIIFDLLYNILDHRIDDWPESMIEVLLTKYRDEYLKDKEPDEQGRQGLRMVFAALNSRHDVMTIHNGVERVLEINELRIPENGSWVDDDKEKKCLLELDPEIKELIKPLLYKSIHGISIPESAIAWETIAKYFDIDGVYEALLDIYKDGPKPWETASVDAQIEAVRICGRKKRTSIEEPKRWTEEDKKTKQECYELINTRIQKILEFGQLDILAWGVEKMAMVDEEFETMCPANWLDLERPKSEWNQQRFFGTEDHWHRTMAELEEEDRLKFTRIMEKIMEKEEMYNLLKGIYDASHTSNVLPLKNAEILICDEVMELMDIIWDVSTEQHLLAKLSALISVDKWSPKLKDRLCDELVGADVELLLTHNNWTLCNRSEDKLWQSINLGLTVLVEGKLLLKGSGKISALCLESFVSSSGFRFVKGCWYSPSQEGHDKYFNCLVGEVSEVKIESKETWVLMRNLGYAFNTYSDNSNRRGILENRKLFMAMIKKYITSGIPDKGRVLNKKQKGFFLEYNSESLNS